MGVGISGASLTPPLVLPTRYAFNSLAATYSTTSATAVSAGNGVSIVAPSSGVLKVESSCVASNSSSNDAFQVSIYRSTVGIPAAGSAPNAGDVLLYQTSRTKAAANDTSEVTAHIIDTGRTPGATYYYYRALAATAGGTANALGGNNQTTLLVSTLGG